MFPPPTPLLQKKKQEEEVYFLTITGAEVDWEKQQGLQVPPLAQWADCLIVLILFNCYV